MIDRDSGLVLHFLYIHRLSPLLLFKVRVRVWLDGERW